jgi:hypothetical protein
MNKPTPSDEEDFQHEMDTLRLILQRNLQRLKQDPALGQRLDFWMESARFLETELEIWEQVGDDTKRDQAVEKMQKVLGILQELIDHLNDGLEDEKD